MRILAPQSLVRATSVAERRTALAGARWMRNAQQHRGFAKVNNGKELGVPDVWFSNSAAFAAPGDGEGPGSGLEDHRKNDERTVKLGKTIRVLQERLPTLLISPLPQEILSPQISLQLFPSTHPHLPTVTGKIAYTAALWTSPVAWGRVPVVGNVKLIIMSERMVKNGSGPSSTHFSPSSSSSAPSSTNRSEKLIVRWKTCPKAKTQGVASSSIDKINEWLGGDAVDKDKEFHGLFVFEFDEEGRVVTHVIEHAEEGSLWDGTTKVISVTDWLLGRAWGKREEEQGLALGCCDGGGRGERYRR